MSPAEPQQPDVAAIAPAPDAPYAFVTDHPPGLEKVAAELMRSFQIIRKIAPADEDAGSLYRGNVREFRECSIALTLKTARDTVVASHARCLAAGALDEGSALTGPGGTRLFSVTPDGDPASCLGLAVIRGEDRFATFIAPQPLDARNPDVSGEDIQVVRWKPLAPGTMVSELDSLPEDGDELSPAEILSMSGRLAPYALPDSAMDLGQITTEILAGQRLGRDVSVAAMSDLRFETPDGAFTRITGRTEDQVDAWEAYADAMRPIVEAEGLDRLSDAEMLKITGFSSMAAIAAARVDRGFYGAAAAWGEDALSGGIWKFRMLEMAEPFAQLARDTLGTGYAWGKKALIYADHDRETFAVSSPDGRVLGRWHRNIDLIAPIQAHMAVVTLGDDGKPARMEIHAAYRPLPDPRSEGWDTARKMIEATASSLELHADESADPPRLTRRALANRIASGQPLPRPAGGLDLLTGEILPGTGRDALQVIENAFYGYREDRWAMEQISKGEEPGYVGEDVTDFTEEGEELEAAPSLSPAP